MILSDNNLSFDYDRLRAKTFQYCKKITGSDWDAEDITQETLVKLFKLVKENPTLRITNSFIFRISQNLWIDQLRKKKIKEGILEEIQHVSIFSSYCFETRELLEDLAQQLPAKYLVVLLLMDVFDFTAKEVANFILSSESSVLVTLHRARKKLKKLEGSVETLSLPKSGNSLSFHASSLFEGVVHAFKERDPEYIYQAYLQLLNKGIRIHNISIHDNRYVFVLKDPSGNFFRISTEIFRTVCNVSGNETVTYGKTTLVTGG